MSDKLPFINGSRSDSRIYDFDNPKDVNDLKIKLINKRQQLTISDRYTHYHGCNYVVIELKGNHIKKGINQISLTVERLRAANHKVDYGAIVLDHPNDFEKKLFKADHNDPSFPILLEKKGSDWLPFRGDVNITWLLFMKDDVDRVWREGLDQYGNLP